MERNGFIKSNKHSLVLWIILLCFAQVPFANSFEWNNSVSIPNLQFSIQNSYDTPSTDVILQKAYYAGSGAAYFAATAGPTTAVFSKHDSSRNSLWSKSYDPFVFYHASFVVASDESTIFWIEEGAAQVNILKLNPSDGELMNYYSE